MTKDKNKPYRKSVPLKRTFVLFVEGECTENFYFKYFHGVTIKSPADKTNKVKFVESVKKTIQNTPKLQGCEIWCVFDFDYSANEDKSKTFDEGIQLAKKYGYHVAYSNDAFELWLLLHYKAISHENQLSRGELNKMLSEEFGIDYSKGKTFAEKLYHLLLDKQTIAIKNARELHEMQTKIHGGSYHAQNPCTTVYQLVKILTEQKSR